LLVLVLSQEDSLGQSGDSSIEVTTNTPGDLSELPAPPVGSQNNVQRSSSGNGAALSLSPTSTGNQPTSWTFLNSHSLGSSASWLTPQDDSRIYPVRWLTTYSIKFTTDCPQSSVTLNYASTGSTFVYLNSHLIVSWALPWPQTHSITLSPSHLLCGCNHLTITVFNYYYPSPAALIYSLTQNTQNCYQCQNHGIIAYNR
jgi:hypothetical protein